MDLRARGMLGGVTVFTAIVEQTRYTLEVPWMPALWPLTGASVVAAILAQRRTGPLARAISVPLSIVCAMAAFSVTHGWFLLSQGRSPLAARTFSTVFIAVGALWSAAVFAAVHAVVALIASRAKDAPRFTWVWPLPAALLAMTSATVAHAVRAQLGPPAVGLPRLIVHGAERGQRDERYPIELVLGYPAVRGWIFGRPERTLTPVERARANVLCSDCSFEFMPTQIGPHHRVIRARYYGYTLERDWSFTATDNHGDPRLPLRVGARWIFRARHEGSTAAGGWGVAIADRRLSHLVPRDVGRPRLGDERLEFSVDASELRDGVRHFHLSYAATGGRSHSFWVYGQDEQTWLAAGRPLFVDRVEATRAVTLPAGLFACRIDALPLSVCSDGSNPNLPPGPIWGVRDSHEGTGLLVTLLTFGAVIPGSGPRSSWCFDRFIPGTGDALRTVERVTQSPAHPPLATPNAAPYRALDAERLALCEPSAQALAVSRTSAPSRSSRPRVRAR